MLTYAGSSVTGCASQRLSWLYSTFNFVSHFGADVAAELEQLPADRRIGCSVHRGCIFTFRYFWKTFCEPPESQCVLVFPLIADLLCVVKKPRLLLVFGRLCGTLPRDAEQRDVYYGQKSHPLYSEALFSFLTLLCSSHTSSYRQSALQSRRDTTADECEHPQPHKWKWLICHSSSKVAFSVPLPPHSRKGWTQFGERPSLLLLTKRRPGAWGKHFLSEIR